MNTKGASFFVLRTSVAMTAPKTCGHCERKCVCILVMDPGCTRKLGFGCSESIREMGWAQLERGFFKKSSNMVKKNWKKPCFETRVLVWKYLWSELFFPIFFQYLMIFWRILAQVVLNPFLGLIPSTWNPGFGYNPDPSLDYAPHLLHLLKWVLM